MNKQKTECWKKLERLFNRLVFEYGEYRAKKIFEIIMRELGADRVTVSFGYYKRKLRDQQIRRDFHGGNYEELAIQHGITERQIRTIVHHEE